SGVGRAGEHGIEEVVELGGGEADRAVGGAVVETDLAAGVVDEAAGEDDVGDVAGPLVGCERGEDPGRKPAKDAGRLVEVEEGEPDPVDLTGDGVLDAVIEEQPALVGPQRRWAEPDPKRVPPGAGARLQYLLRGRPAEQVGGAGEQDLAAGAAELGLRSVEENPIPVDPLG